MIRWQRVNDEPFEYAIQQGPHGDEFVKLLNGECLRRDPQCEVRSEEAIAWRYKVSPNQLNWCYDENYPRNPHVWEVTPLYASVAEGSWMPIETAPTTGKEFLGFQATPGDNENRIEVCWAINESFWCGANGLMPTHWMPLPAPPLPSADGGPAA